MNHEQLELLCANVAAACLVVLLVFVTIGTIGGGIFCAYLGLKEHFEAERRDKCP